jgi:hypothetical protein
MSEFPEESELLLRGDLRFKITGVRQIDFEGYDMGGKAIGTILIDAEEIS